MAPVPTLLLVLMAFPAIASAQNNPSSFDKSLEDIRAAAQAARAEIRALPPRAEAAASYVPDGYAPRAASGFRVLLSREVMNGREGEVLALLGAQLEAIARAVPSNQLEVLRRVTIWVEWQETDHGAAYNPSRDWLVANGRNPEKEHGIEIGNWPHYAQWGSRDEPWELLHEMAHGYQQLALGQEYSPINDAYENAMRSGLYAAAHYKTEDGPLKRAYAATNAHEYFAELTTAYFGRTMYYPFTRDELQSYDPTGYRLMTSVWGSAASR